MDNKYFDKLGARFTDIAYLFESSRDLRVFELISTQNLAHNLATTVRLYISLLTNPFFLFRLVDLESPT